MKGRKIMPDFVTLTCPTCGGKLEITNDIERFACGYCGQEHIVKRGGGIISLLPIADDVKGIRVSADKTAAELGLVRLTEELENFNLKRETLLPEFYEKHHDRFSSSGVELDSGIYYFIRSLVNNYDKKKIPFFLNVHKEVLFYKERILALNEKDLTYLIENAFDDAIKPKDKEKFIDTIDTFSKLKSRMLELDKKIQNTESEISRLRGIVSQND